ncbi:MAG: choline dehydrogenase [Mesorhizobium amorphae]|nr:MAG: choline dehydrogenase [Mesorhizobium amorphae]
MPSRSPPHEAEEFDYVVVGGGAAGCVLAARLSEDPGVTVCLLEAGPVDRSPFMKIPAGFIRVFSNPAYIWPFASEPTDMTAGRAIPMQQGRVLGGSSSINGMIYVRGQPADYDEWAALGNHGWDHAGVLPYFRKSETWLGADPDGVRGREGPAVISPMDWSHPLSDAFFEAAEEQGYPENPDYNGASQEGVGYCQRFIHRGMRMSATRAFLNPARKRSNLSILTRAEARRVLLRERRAFGVAYALGGDRTSERIVRARREVVLTAGAINTPKLLLLSGIGDATALARLGIDVEQSLPGVGQRLRDHYYARLVARVRGVKSINEASRGPALLAEIAKWTLGKPSILSLTPSLIHIFARSRPELNRPDLQGVFAPASFQQGSKRVLDRHPGMTFGFWQHQPASSGLVALRSADPIAAPFVQPNYLEAESDRVAMVAALKLARRILTSKAFEKYAPIELLPGPECRSDDELLDFAKRNGNSSWHLNGTAAMGPAEDPAAVVSSRLSVHGVAGLRVADASVMPTSPSANTYAPTLMIAERAADFIRYPDRS